MSGRSSAEVVALKTLIRWTRPEGVLGIEDRLDLANCPTHEKQRMPPTGVAIPLPTDAQSLEAAPAAER